MQPPFPKKIISGFKGTTLTVDHLIVQAILSKQVSGVILFAHNICSATQLKTLTQQLQHYANEAQIPDFIISIDYEGGTVERLVQTLGFPPTKTAAALGQLSLHAVKQEAEKMAETLAHLGFNLNFAPVVDVNINPANPIIGSRERAFSNDPHQVAAYARLFIEQYNQRGITCVLKHFPGHGSSAQDSHLGLTDITKTWHPSELEPYRQLLQTPNDKLLIMTAHVVHRSLDPTGLPASLSKAITTDLLHTLTPHRYKIVVDDLEMRAISHHYSLKRAIQLAIQAGADYFIFGNQWADTPLNTVASLMHQCCNTSG